MGVFTVGFKVCMWGFRPGCVGKADSAGTRSLLAGGGGGEGGD